MAEIARAIVALTFWFFAVGVASTLAAQERVIVSHSVRRSLSIGPLLYGIQKGFYKDDGIDLLYVSIRADLGITTPQMRFYPGFLHGAVQKTGAFQLLSFRARDVHELLDEFNGLLRFEGINYCLSQAFVHVSVQITAA